ncbi:polyphosphate polymerase domain-containing protein [Spongiactinospora sp. TRM90649]|uniref:polyphosphate polymerase domain-containing protein n=1 Tax=Spongiactinospora sp. TRM90649 TaxID=3031114 RepID=UPI0023F66DF8|nr:polyphosphate polymerase domain-containing protein [Spongiactinospora sp. TRM90649]MDF5751861.1 polyphosphate polymerase domain-containing protein [Spongiactinospora sp. TRM90649]
MNGGRARDADLMLAGIAAGLSPVGLADTAPLLSRTDLKYLVPATLLAELVALLGERFAVLEIGWRRQFRYSSTYFDTPDLLTYRQHRQGRRRRFKIRTRSYLDSGDRWLEVKLSGGRSSTDKHRMPYQLLTPAPAAETLPSGGRAFVSDTVLRGLRVRPPDTLMPILTTDYRRVTLVDRTGEARLTCDTGLVCHDGRRAFGARRDYVLLESKSVTGQALPDRLLRTLGVRPAVISKYCMAVALLRGAPANRWQPVLRDYFRAPPRSRVVSRGEPMVRCGTQCGTQYGTQCGTQSCRPGS